MSIKYKQFSAQSNVKKVEIKNSYTITKKKEKKIKNHHSVRNQTFLFFEGQKSNQTQKKNLSNFLDINFVIQD